MSRRIAVGLLSLLLVGLWTSSVAAQPFPPHPKTIAAPHAAARIQSVWILGDSLTLGLHASSIDTMYRSLLYKRLQASNPPGSIRYFLWNSVCTLGGLEQKWDTLPGKPTLLFIEVGINDLSPETPCPYIPPEAWQSRYGAILDRIQQDAPDATLIVGTIPWMDWPEDSETYRQAQQYNQWIIAEAQARGILVADLWGATVGRPDGISTPEQPSIFYPYHGDNFHPNDIGHRRLANAFFLTYLQTKPHQYIPLQLHAFQN